MRSLYFFLVLVFICSSSHLALSSTAPSTTTYVKILDEYYSTDTQELSLREKNLETFPPEILQLLFLEKLDLSHNDIQELPNEISLLKNLKKLDLHRNHIPSLPSAITSLENLKFINLHNNPLISLPFEIIKFEGQIIFTSKTARKQDTFINILALLMQRPNGTSIIDFKKR